MKPRTDSKKWIIDPLSIVITEGEYMDPQILPFKL